MLSGASFYRLALSILPRTLSTLINRHLTNIFFIQYVYLLKRSFEYCQGFGRKLVLYGKVYTFYCSHMQISDKISSSGVRTDSPILVSTAIDRNFVLRRPNKSANNCFKAYTNSILF